MNLLNQQPVNKGTGYFKPNMPVGEHACKLAIVSIIAGLIIAGLTFGSVLFISTGPLVLGILLAVVDFAFLVFFLWFQFMELHCIK